MRRRRVGPLDPVVLGEDAGRDANEESPLRLLSRLVEEISVQEGDDDEAPPRARPDGRGPSPESPRVTTAGDGTDRELLRRYHADGDLEARGQLIEQHLHSCARSPGVTRIAASNSRISCRSARSD